MISTRIHITFNKPIGHSIINSLKKDVERHIETYTEMYVENLIFEKINYHIIEITDTPGDSDTDSSKEPIVNVCNHIHVTTAVKIISEIIYLCKCKQYIDQDIYVVDAKILNTWEGISTNHKTATFSIDFKDIDYKK